MRHLLSFSDSPEVVIKSISPVIEGNDVPLVCLVTGNPPPDVLWIRGSDNSVLTKNTTATLRNVTRKDSGLFQCYAWNGIGKRVSSNVTVDVLCEYILTTYEANHEVMVWLVMQLEKVSYKTVSWQYYCPVAL